MKVPSTATLLFVNPPYTLRSGNSESLHQAHSGSTILEHNAVFYFDDVYVPDPGGLHRSEGGCPFTAVHKIHRLNW